MGWVAWANGLVMLLLTPSFPLYYLLALQLYLTFVHAQERL